MGGGIRLFGGSATFIDSDVYENSAPRGGGVYITKEGLISPTLDMQSFADIYNNSATSGDGFGGGLYLKDGIALLADGSDVYSNNAIEGGGVYLIESVLTITDASSEIMDNSAIMNGGGAYALNSIVNLNNQAELRQNIAGTDGTGSGGGAYLDDSDLLSDAGMIVFNTAASFGGGVYAVNNSELAMSLDNFSSFGISNSKLNNNIANSGYGGGVYAMDSWIDLRETFVERNSSQVGGGIYTCRSNVILNNVVLAGNNIISNFGDGIRLFDSSTLSGSHNTIAYNDAAGANSGNAININNSILTMSNSIIWGHASSINDISQTITYSDIEGGYSGAGNLNVDPLFTNSVNYNFLLLTDSPVIDRCASGLSRDIYNKSRPVIFVRPGTPYDMGACEFRIYVSGLWTGFTNSDWHTATNWDDGNVPDSTIDIIIPDVTNNPVISANVSCGSLTISTGGELDIGSSITLNISGDLSLHDNSLISNGGVIIFSGTDCHLIDNRTTKSSLGNMQIE